MAKKIEIDKVRDLYQKSAARAQAERYSYERDWFRNVLYFLGIQWIIYSPQTRKWHPRKIAKWVPRPVTNKFASVAMSMIQVLSQNPPAVRARAAGNAPDDIAAAAVADRNFDVILKEADADEARRILAAWKTLCGTAIIHPHYDNDPIHGTTTIQHLLCQQCGQTFPPDMAMPDQKPPNPNALIPGGERGSGMGMDGAEAMGQGGPIPDVPGMSGGMPQEPSGPVCPYCQSPGAILTPDGSGEELPNGKLDIEIFSPFEVMMDLEGRSWKDIPMLNVRRRYDIDVVRRKYNRFDLEPDNNSNVGGAIGLNLLRAIAYAAGNAVYGTGIASGRSLGDDQSITLDQLWVRPCSDYPEGLVAVFSNNEIINEDTIKDGIPYHNRKGDPLWPWHLDKFDHVPGRTFGRTPLDDVAPKQEQRNKIESLIQLIITRSANPLWLIAKNTGVTQITGEPGQMVEGNWGVNPSLKPERVPGENIPTSVIAWLEKTDKDIDELAGIFEVLKGTAPAGVTAGTALRLLLERAQTRFTPVAKYGEKVWQDVCSDLLCMAQEFWTDERISKIQGPGNTWEIIQFSKADLKGDVDVIVEAGSSLPKSIVGEQALVQDLVTMGVINPQDPETQYKILERFGCTDLLGDTDENIKQAQRENYDFQNEDIEPVMDLIIDMHQAHVKIHKQLALTSDFKTWAPEKQNVFRQHILSHMMALAPPMPAMTSGAGGGQEGGAGASGEASATDGGGSAPLPEAGADTMEAPMPGGVM
jgi:hypothetical protein